MNKQQNPLGIRVGDVVEIFFAHNPSRGAFCVTVTEVSDRTMSGSDAYIAYAPKEDERDLEAEKFGIPYGCSASHVRAILERAPYPMARTREVVNVFAEELARSTGRDNAGGWLGYYTVGAVCVTHKGLERLVVRALASAKDTLDRPYDPDRFKVMWERDGHRGKVVVPNVPDLRGYTSEELQRYYVAVNWKVFKKYVLANRHRLLLSRKEMVKAGAKFNKIMWDSGFDVDADADAGTDYRLVDEDLDYFYGDDDPFADRNHPGDDDKFPRGEGPDAYL